MYNKIKEGQLEWSHLLRHCLLKHVIEGPTEGRVEVTERRGRRCRQLLHDLKET
jgi:hypothetical protein